MKTNALIILMGLCSFIAIATEKDEMTTPKLFNTYGDPNILNDIYAGKLSLENYVQSDKSITSKWTVYSDRANNKVYVNDNSRQPKSSSFDLDFMEPLAVYEVRGNWVKVVRRITSNNGRDQVLGWVPASNLVLSKYAMLNEKHTPKKAMTLISFKEEPVGGIPPNVSQYRFFSIPDDKSTVRSISKTFRIFYVLKEVSGLKLLSEADVINNQNLTMIQARVGGWMPDFHITDWEHRACLEPSTNVADYGSSKVPVFLTDKTLSNFQNQGISDLKGSVMNYNIRSSPPDPNIMRMPILDAYDDGERYHVATVGSLRGDLDAEKIADAQSKANNARKKLQKVNILFVIDATASMRSYYPAIAKSINGIISSNNLLSASIKVQFGAVVYRDYADGDKSYEVMPCTGSSESVIAFINRTKCESLDSDLPEAQYHGMINGINEARLDPNSSNVVVLIGDAGNHANDTKGYKRDDVVDVLAKYQANVIAFQVINGQDQSYSDFNYDAKRFLFHTGQRLASTIEEEAVTAQLQKVTNSINTYELKFSSEGNTSFEYLSFGRFTYASSNEMMETSILEQNIQLACKKYFDHLVNFVVAAEGLSNAKGGDYEEVVVEAICDRLGLDDEECKTLIEQVNQFSFEGYTSRRFYNKVSEAFIPVVFISQEEFKNLSNALNRVADPGASKSKRREVFKDALINQAMQLTGDINDEAVKKLSLNEVYEMLLGIEFTTNPKYAKLATTPLKDLNGLKKKDLEAFNDFITSFQNSARSFDASRFQSRRFELAGQSFYWIPLSRFPGNE